MKGKDLLIAGAVVVGGYLLYKQVSKAGQAISQLPANLFNGSVGVVAAPFVAVQKGIDTPGGLLGKDSATDLSYNYANFISTLSAAVAAPAASVISAPSSFVSSVQTGINTPGGLLGANSLTDLGYQFNKIFGGLF
jgi:hypothetical protein